MPDYAAVLLSGLTDEQGESVSSRARRLLVVAGAGSGKTEVMSRRVAWWVSVDGVDKSSIAAFTFTNAAAEEMKFRIRRQMQKTTAPGEDVTLGDMYVGTIHGFCLAQLREHAPDEYYNYDVIDEAARAALVARGFHGFLGLAAFKDARRSSQIQATEDFLQAYDLLNEYGQLRVELPPEPPPRDLRDEVDWVRRARLLTDVGVGPAAQAFAVSAARYYAYLRARRFLDFSTAQGEFIRKLDEAPDFLDRVRARFRHVMVDEFQDVNVVQDRLIRAVIGDDGWLTAVGDHRQAIYGFRGSRVQIMAALSSELRRAPHGDVLTLSANFRSTPRIVGLANEWARTITAEPAFPPADMVRGTPGGRADDRDPSHTLFTTFPDRNTEAEWIGATIDRLVAGDQGIAQDRRGDGDRGISYGDIGLLLRSSTDARRYMEALERRGIPAIFRAGPDLFSQAEVLLFVGFLALIAGMNEFYDTRTGMAARIRAALGPTVVLQPEAVLRAAAAALRVRGLPLADDVEDRVVHACRLLQRRFQEDRPSTEGEVRPLVTPELRSYLKRPPSRRVFPQQVFQLLLAEAEVWRWDQMGPRGQTAMFHVGAFSNLIKGMETPGWTQNSDFRWQIIGLLNWGAENARTDEAPLLVEPDAVRITTIHGAKGLEYAVVFLADVNARRFPSNFARRQPNLPFEGALAQTIDPARLADNASYDAERRLMYVALTRAERYIFISASGAQQSKFRRQLVPLVQHVGGVVQGAPSANIPVVDRISQRDAEGGQRLVTSFSDLRYYLECPHDFYLRKVLGFTPTIDQAFGYGKAVHNLMRAVHTDPRRWAELADDPARLEAAVRALVNSSLFYLRYTTGDPARQMREKAVAIVHDYVTVYAGELGRMEFEPERAFETLLEEGDVLVSGAIDVVRLDDPPRVSLIDFKSGLGEGEAGARLDSDEMRLQISLYGLAARKELEYSPDLGLLRYLGEPDPTSREVEVPLTEAVMDEARQLVLGMASAIRSRRFDQGPRRPAINGQRRCGTCDFVLFCGRGEAAAARDDGD
ncbi:MAG: ATP-dependent DNA helicase [Pseudomonadota bacterium]